MRHGKIWFLALLFLVTACNEDEQIAYSLETDAYMRGIKIEGKTVYAPVLLAKSTTKTASLTATDDSSTEYTLEAYWNNNLTYRWVPYTSDYKEEPAQSTTFTFSAVTEDNPDEPTNISESVTLSSVPKAFEITEFTYDSENSEITLTWENAGADSYLIQIAKKIDEYPIFQSVSLVPGNNEANSLTTSIKLSSFKWFSSPVAGNTYLLTVHAFNLSASNTTKIDGEFIATKEFTWGR